jgi:hypothetical protein
MTTSDFERRRVQNLPTVVVFKWSEPVLDEGYIPFPKRLLRCLPRLFSQQGSVGDLQVVLAIVDYARPNLTRPPSYDYLAFNAGMTVPVFKDHVEEMEKRGWLTASGPDDAVVIRIDGLLRAIVRLTEDGTRKPDEYDDPEEGEAKLPF